MLLPSFRIVPGPRSSCRCPPVHSFEAGSAARLVVAIAAAFVPNCTWASILLSLSTCPLV